MLGSVPEGVLVGKPERANSQFRRGRHSAMMPMLTEPTAELVHLPALTLAGLIRDRQVTTVEVMEAHLARITERNEVINAIVAVATGPG